MVRHHARAKDLDRAPVAKRPLSLQYIRQDDWLVNLFKEANVKGKRKKRKVDKVKEDVDDEAQEDVDEVPSTCGWLT